MTNNCYSEGYCIRFFFTNSTHFKKNIFLYLKAKNEDFGYEKEQYSLFVIVTFKGQDNAEIKEWCSKNGQLDQ